MTLCDVCLSSSGVIDGICQPCHEEWLAYQEAKSDADGDDDA